MSVILTFLVALAGGFLPAINVELYLLAAIAATRQPDLAALVIATALGQMVAKLGWYMAGSGATSLPFPSARRRVERLRVASERHRQLGTAGLVASATLGLPPFAIISVVSGIARIGVVLFLTVGLAGRLVRFSVVALAPGLIRSVWPFGGGP
jgi:membrane protein YqaA with SNARE-associated domain